MASSVTVGNVIHASLLGAGILYGAGVVYFTQPDRTGIVDEEWREEGFCIHNKDAPYWSSFDTCLYVDVFFSVILGVLYYFWRKLPGMEHCSEIVPMVIASTVGHGLAHGAMAHELRSGSTDGLSGQDVKDVALWKSLAFCALFWFPLLKAALQKLPNSTVAYLALVVTYAPLLAGGLPVEHRFAYVQTVVTLAFHSSQLMLDGKEKQRREYWSLPLIALLPPIVTSYNEALGCNAYFRDLGGHTLYDASIIIGFLVYYLDCYRYHVMTPSSKLKDKAQ